MSDTKGLQPAFTGLAWPINIENIPQQARAFVSVIIDNANRFGIAPQVIASIIDVESSFDTFAIRYEPAFLVKYVPAAVVDVTERTARAMSWGLMQVMGEVAREFGYEGKYLSGLCVPSTGIEFGCRVFARKLQHSGNKLPEALLLYNGGDDPNYADIVLARRSRFV